MPTRLKITRPPERKYYTISEVADELDLKPYVLRFWEKEFPMLRPRKNRSGKRAYQPKDIEMAGRIRDLLYRDGYTIEGARQQLRKKTSKRAAKRAVGASANPGTIRKELVALRDEVKEIIALLE